MRILLLTLLLAGGLPAGTSQSQTAVKPAPQAMEPLVGTLEIDTGPLPHDFGGDLLEAGWLFINGEFRGQLPISRRLMVAPGPYELRVVLAGYKDQQPVFWTVYWPPVVITTGSTRTLRLQDAIAQVAKQNPVTGAIISRRPLDAGIEFSVSDLRDPWSHLAVHDGMDEYFQKTAAEEFDRAWERYRTRGEFARVEALFKQFQEAPPSRPVVWIAVDETLGGPREFDVEQLKFLRNSLRPDIGGWIHRIVQYPPSLSQNRRAFYAAQVKALEALSQQRAKYVDAVFQEIIANLEKAAAR